MGTKKQYIAPALTVVTFKAERGYATSGLPDPAKQILEIQATLSGITLTKGSGLEAWGAIDEATFGLTW